MAIILYHYDGASWLGAGIAGSIRDAVGAYFCGCGRGYDGDGPYTTKILYYEVSKPWRQRNF